MHRRHLLIFFLGCMMLVSPCFGVDKKKLSDAFAAVDANLKTPAGKQYDESFGNELYRNYLPNMKQCKQSAPAGTKLEPFDMVLKLDAQGKVQEVLVYPETQLSNCFRTALLPGKFTAPAHGDYWVNVHMTFK